jgi:ABC-type nitrate/sulfonate/bicarbonate transport system permease component
MQSRLWKAGFIVAVAALWEAAGRSGDQLLLPPLSTVLTTMTSLLLSGELTDNFMASMTRLGEGLVAAAIIAFVAAKMIRSSEPVRDAVAPTLATIAAMPWIALLPVVVLLFGIGEAAKALTVAACAIFPMLSQAVSGEDDASPRRNANPVRWNEPTRAMASGTYSDAFDFQVKAFSFKSLRVGFSYGLAALIVAEFFASNSGLGYLMLQYMQMFNTPALYAITLVVFIIGVVGVALLNALENATAKH